MTTTGVYCLIHIISGIFNGCQIPSSFNIFTLFAFSLFSTLLCFPILYLFFFKLRSVRTPKLFKLDGNIRAWQSAISKELASLKEDSAEHLNEQIFELININLASNRKKNKNEEKNIKRFLYVTMTYFSEAMHYAQKQKTGKHQSHIGYTVTTGFVVQTPPRSIEITAVYKDHRRHDNPTQYVYRTYTLNLGHNSITFH